MDVSKLFQGLSISRILSPSSWATSSPPGSLPPSHNTSTVGYHVTQHSLLVQLNMAVQAAFPTRHRSPYVDVNVLLMTWESDDLGVEREVQCLESLFRDVYHFEVEHWKIPDHQPGRHATKKVIELMEVSTHADNLVIFYYAGHAMRNSHQPGGLPIWFANRGADSPRFDSSCVQPHLCQVDENSADVLLLYDCCHPANGHGSIESSRAVISLLAACGFESRAPEVGTDSFTHSLVQVLADAARQNVRISVPDLHCRQLNWLRDDRPKVLMRKEASGKVGIHRSHDGVPLFTEPVRRTPVYCQLSLNDRSRAIFLSPLPKSTTLESGAPFIDLSNESPAEHETRSKLHVLLSVSLEEDSFDEAEFKDWICSAPDAVRSIRVGALPSCSTLLLMQVPVAVWDMLPASPAISFVNFVKDTGTMQSQVGEVALGLSLLRTPGSDSDSVHLKLDEILRMQRETLGIQREMLLSVNAGNSKTHLLQFLMEQISQNPGMMGHADTAATGRDQADVPDGTTLRGYTPDDLFKILNFNHYQISKDGENALKIGSSFALADVQQAAAFVATPQVRKLLNSPSPGIVAVDGHFDRGHIGNVNPLSHVCATLSQALRQQARQDVTISRPARPMLPQLDRGGRPIVVLEYFCAEHLADADDLRGPQGLIRSLTCQLLLSLLFNEWIGQHDAVYSHYLSPGEQDLLAARDLAAVCRLFVSLTGMVPRDVPIYCVVDGWSRYERDAWRNDYNIVLDMFHRITIASDLNAAGGPFKLLLTNPTESRWLGYMLGPDQRLSLR
ncbi:hypothetical protein CONLIGDRAFT_712867 [Coniochaeta ligniaria NRRL 30616]|uniref:Peptidase C14 caspase domain-containing protein n=1 Tax=Coniochaeta ligniaria NRRL 30616 TaxID=1408157 RepID=A0A1J7JGS6_9PEZI|nr:hypothetical protein CONLIGDRAFT_712867 [Coniochaeta ligniaria NRRL 30616]